MISCEAVFGKMLKQGFLENSSLGECDVGKASAAAILGDISLTGAMFYSVIAS